MLGSSATGRIIQYSHQRKVSVRNAEADLLSFKSSPFDWQKLTFWGVVSIVLIINWLQDWGKCPLHLFGLFRVPRVDLSVLGKDPLIGYMVLMIDEG